MNRKYLLPLVVVSCLVTSCDPATPQTYFGQAVLNLNLFHGFAGPGMERELKQPSVKLGGKDGKETVPMKRKEVVEGKLRSAEEYQEKVKKLKVTDDTRAMLEASLAAYDYIIPVYRNEYTELAALYDKGAASGEIETLSRTIREKYADGYQSRMDAVVAAAKPYTERHGIQVKWDVRTSP